MQRFLQEYVVFLCLRFLCYVLRCALLDCDSFWVIACFISAPLTVSCTVMLHFHVRKSSWCSWPNVLQYITTGSDVYSVGKLQSRRRGMPQGIFTGIGHFHLRVAALQPQLTLINHNHSYRLARYLSNSSQPSSYQNVLPNSKSETVKVTGIQWKFTVSPTKLLHWMKSVEQFCRGNSNFSLFQI